MEAGLQRVRKDLARRQKDLQNLEAVKVRIQSDSTTVPCRLTMILSRISNISSQSRMSKRAKSFATVGYAREPYFSFDLLRPY